jgi:hypothetical protein
MQDDRSGTQQGRLIDEAIAFAANEPEGYMHT